MDRARAALTGAGQPSDTRAVAGLTLALLTLSPLRSHQASDAYLRADLPDDGTVALRIDTARGARSPGPCSTWSVLSASGIRSR